MPQTTRWLFLIFNMHLNLKGINVVCCASSVENLKYKSKYEKVGVLRSSEMFLSCVSLWRKGRNVRLRFQYQQYTNFLYFDLDLNHGEANYSSSTGWKSQLGTGIRSLNYNFGSVPRAEISPCNYPLNVSRCDCRFTTLHSCCYRRLPATWWFLRHFVVDPRQSFVLNGLLK